LKATEPCDADLASLEACKKSLFFLFFLLLLASFSVIFFSTPRGYVKTKKVLHTFSDASQAFGIKELVDPGSSGRFRLAKRIVSADSRAFWVNL